MPGPKCYCIVNGISVDSIANRQWWPFFFCFRPRKCPTGCDPIVLRFSPPPRFCHQRRHCMWYWRVSRAYLPHVTVISVYDVWCNMHHTPYIIHRTVQVRDMSNTVYGGLCIYDADKIGNDHSREWSDDFWEYWACSILGIFTALFPGLADFVLLTMAGSWFPWFRHNHGNQISGYRYLTRIP